MNKYELKQNISYGKKGNKEERERKEEEKVRKEYINKSCK